VTTPYAVEDLPHLTLVRAEAVAASGAVAKAYDDMLAAVLADDRTPEYLHALVKYGAALGRSAKDIEAEIWTRRLARAQPFKEFDLQKLGGKEHVKSSELRGKVVVIEFWFPG
jgi:hypothetical protein